MRRWASALASVAALATLSACTDSPSALPTPSTSTPTSPSGPANDPRSDPGEAPRGLERFYDQPLNWTDCDSNQCATLTVPLDYNRPGGQTIALPLLRRPAGEKSQGSIVVNPGGPGGSGTDMAKSANFYLTSTVLDRFDIVGFDPRGVGTIDCASDADVDAYLASDPTPPSLPAWRSTLAMIGDFGAGCAQLSGALAAHVSTVEAAKDMDVLRAALGKSALDYYGASYGTKLGSTYADLFPDHVGRLVLDGAVAPGIGTYDMTLEQAAGFETAMTAYLSDCVDSGSCFLGSTVDAARQRVLDLFDQIDASPLPTASGRDLTLGLAVYGVITPLYERNYWTLLSAGLQEAIGGAGDTLLTLADAYSSRQADGTYSTNILEANLAINCLDDPTVYRLPQLLKAVPEFEDVSPVFGPFLVSALAGCRGVTDRAGFKTPKIDAPAAAPIVVIGTTRDPATPYEWAVQLADALDSGVLISRDGDGHTGYNKDNSCVDEAVDSFYLDGTVPDDGLTC
ncbi:MAG: alpha/beta hydrolase [Nocardioides sp.]